MIVPRIAAFEAPKPRVDPPPSAFVFRQVVEYPRMTDQLAGWLDASLARFKAHQAENASVTPDAYVLDDARGSSFVDAERTLSDRILAARVAKEKAYADRVTAEDEAQLRAQFDKYDADGSGSIEKNELKELLKATSGVDPSDEEVDELDDPLLLEPWSFL